MKSGKEDIPESKLRRYETALNKRRERFLSKPKLRRWALKLGRSKLVKCPLTTVGDDGKVYRGCFNEFCEQECALFRGQSEKGVSCACKKGAKYETEERQAPYKIRGKLIGEIWVKKYKSNWRPAEGYKIITERAEELRKDVRFAVRRG